VILNYIYEFKEMNILVTGGLGYIGSHTVVELAERGNDVIVLDNLSNSSESVMDGIQKITGKKIKAYIGDIRDREILQTIFKDHDIDSVMHFAGLKAVGEGEEKPLLYFDNNVSGSIILFDEMMKAKVNRVIFSSSATVYGEASSVKFKEDMPLNPINVYGKTKYMVEEVLREMKRTYPWLGLAILRYFNPVGANSSGFIGENPNGIPNNLMPYIADVALGIREKLFIFGDDYETPDGTGLRDYIHVKDLALGHIAALNKLDAQTDMITVNLGTGKPYSVLDMIHTFEKASGKNIPYEIIARRQGDLAEYYADPTLAEKLLQWKASSDILTICQDTWRWQKNRINQIKEK
jgi:UDP-glucose 4-epimerase